MAKVYRIPKTRVVYCPKEEDIVTFLQLPEVQQLLFEAEAMEKKTELGRDEFNILESTIWNYHRMTLPEEKREDLKSYKRHWLRIWRRYSPKYKTWCKRYWKTEKFLKYNQEYRRLYPEKVREYKKRSLKRYILKNPLKYRQMSIERHKRYRQKHKDKIKLYCHKYYQKNKEIMYIKSREYIKRNEEKCREIRRRYRQTEIGKRIHNNAEHRRYLKKRIAKAHQRALALMFFIQSENYPQFLPRGAAYEQS